MTLTTACIRTVSLLFPTP